MSNLRPVLFDVLIALIILIGGGAIFARIAGVAEGEAAPGWVSIAPLVLAMLFLGWRTMRRGKQRREQEAEQAERGEEPRERAGWGEVDRVEDPPMDDYQWRSRLESSIRNLGRDAFEQFTMRILEALAIADAKVVRIAFDGAVECTGVRDDAERASVYAICRRSFGSLGANQVRDLRALMEGQADEGLFISNGEFSSSAIDEADGGDQPIELVDGEDLLDLMHTNRLGLVFDEIGRVTAIDEAWFRSLERDFLTREED